MSYPHDITLLYILRKEVIQPHLPIRLPCYDFTPVISPAFGRSFPLLHTNRDVSFFRMQAKQVRLPSLLIRTRG